MNRKPFTIIATMSFLFLFTVIQVPLSPGAQKSNPKIENFINVLKKAGSLEEISRAAKGAGFAQADMPPLMEIFKKDPEIKKKLQMLARKSGTVKSGNVPDLARLKQAKKVAWQQTVTANNRSVAAKLTRVRAPQMSMDNRALSVTTMNPAALAMMKSRSPGPQIDAYILGHTIPARIGHRINVSGAHFGTTRGRVVVLVNRLLVECPVHDWRDSQISITLPYELGVAMGPRSVDGTVWVKMPGGEIGPTATIRLEQQLPAIAALSSPEIMPGQELLIEGENFFPEMAIGSGTGSVRLELASGSIPDSAVSILNWQSNAVRILLSDTLSGMRETAGNIVLTNASGASASRPVTFKPQLDMDVIQWAGGGINNTRFDCQFCESNWLYIMEQIGNFFINMAGYREEKTAYGDIILQNQWRVVSSCLVTHGGGAGHGANILSAPAPGSNLPRVRYEYWADGYAWVSTRVHVVIEGPRGLPHE
ncbi:MAG: hypothetical protein V1793_11440 [Pseudomonadota bacterium]